MSKISDFLEALEKADQEDLDEIDKEIETLYARIEKTKKLREFIAAGLTKEVASEAVTIPQDATEVKEDSSPTRMKVLKHMGVLEKPAPGAKIMSALGIPTGSQTMILRHPWFTRENKGYVLSKYGKESYKRIFQPRA